MELLEVTVCSPSCIIAISALSSDWSARLVTEELWELALMDMLGTDWLLPRLLTVPVLRYGSASYTHQSINHSIIISKGVSVCV